MRVEESTDQRLAPRNGLLGAGIALSLGYGLLGLVLVNSRALYEANQLPWQMRQLSLGLLLSASVLAGILVYILSRRGNSDRWNCRLRQVSPLVLAGALPTLLTPALRWSELTLLIVIAGVSLAFERLLRFSVAASTDRELAFRKTPQTLKRWFPWVLLLLAVGYYAIAVSYWTIASHHRIETRISDLGEFENLFFNALSGKFFCSPAMTGRLEEFSTLGNHAHLGLFLLLPFYALAPRTETLLILQAILVASTAIPAFLLARRRLGAGYALVVAVAFLLLPAVVRPNFYDFHFTSLGLHLSMWLVYFADRTSQTVKLHKRSVLGLVALAIAVLMVREEYGVAVAYVGAMLALASKHRRLGTGIFALGVSYFVAVKFIVMPRFGSLPLHLSYRSIASPGGDGFSAVVATLISNPSFVLNHILTPPKLTFLLHLSVPLLFLWWRRTWLWTALIPGFAFTFLSTDRPPHFSITYQYCYFLLPYLVAATVYGLGYLKPRSRRLTGAVALLGASLLVSFQYGALLGNQHIIGGGVPKTLAPLAPSEKARLKLFQTIKGGLPQNAIVAATETEGPHLAARPTLYSIKLSGIPDDAEYVVVRRPWIPHEKHHVTHALKGGSFGVVSLGGGFALLKRGAETDRNDKALRALGLSP